MRFEPMRSWEHPSGHHGAWSVLPGYYPDAIRFANAASLLREQGFRVSDVVEGEGVQSWDDVIGTAGTSGVAFGPANERYGLPELLAHRLDRYLVLVRTERGDHIALSAASLEGMTRLTSPLVAQHPQWRIGSVCDLELVTRVACTFPVIPFALTDARVVAVPGGRRPAAALSEGQRRFAAAMRLIQRHNIGHVDCDPDEEYEGMGAGAGATLCRASAEAVGALQGLHPGQLGRFLALVETSVGCVGFTMNRLGPLDFSGAAELLWAWPNATRRAVLDLVHECLIAWPESASTVPVARFG